MWNLKGRTKCSFICKWGKPQTEHITAVIKLGSLYLRFKKKNCLRKNLSSFMVSLFGCSGFLQIQRYVKYEVLKKRNLKMYSVSSRQCTFRRRRRERERRTGKIGLQQLFIICFHTACAFLKLLLHPYFPLWCQMYCGHPGVCWLPLSPRPRQFLTSEIMNLSFFHLVSVQKWTCFPTTTWFLAHFS